ncbi:MAG: aspartate--tRNA(Asn) ligase [Candidatus Aenigmarchaeota archaeon]|nr:aspartate--tRNA(Asn) ligase [Candidatus Aenigmarchaeota archaeon]
MIDQLDWERTHYSNEITPELDNKEVIIMGWVRAIRDLKKIIFIKLADREGFVQITIKPEQVNENLLNKIKSLKREYVIAIKGVVKKNKEAPNGFEIYPNDIRILNISKRIPMEIETKKTPALLDTRLNERIIDLRRPEIKAIFKIQAELVNGMEKWLMENGFLRVFTPCLKGAISESGAETFKVPYFNKMAYLREDPQLHRQLLIGSGLDKIFDTGPSWRAEKSRTIRHLCEHRGCAVEIGFIRNEYDIMKIEENVLVAGLKAVQENCKKELKIINKEMIFIPKLPLPVLEFPKIYDILHELGSKIKEGEDLSREDELKLSNYVEEKHNSHYFFINKFPYRHKPFYVYTDGKYARSTDLEAKGGIELSSGGQREHRYDILIKQIKEKGLSLKNLEWFTKFFKYGFPSHGGFNIGIERLTMVMLDLPNIREAVLFPRDPDRLLP